MWRSGCKEVSVRGTAARVFRDTVRCRGWRRAAAGGCVVLAFAALACATPLTVDEERQLGQQVEREVRGQVRIVRDAVIVNYVQQLGRQILAAAGPQPFDYQFFVIADDEINAFATPGGYIYVHTETLLKVRNVSELVGVLAHEVGHVAKRHIAQNYNRARSTGLLYQLGVVVAGAVAGPAAADVANLGGGLAATAYLNSFGREAEREADTFAVLLMPRARYDPHGLVTFFQTLMQEAGDTPLAFLSSHPATGERIANTQQQIQEQRLPSDLRVHDNGRLEIIQDRIRLLQPASRSRER